MGVPVVSLRGDRHSARVGASLLTAAGFPGWISDSAENYVDIARSLAQDSEGLKKIRASLRERVAQSGLCAGERYTRHVESAYVEMLRLRSGMLVV